MDTFEEQGALFQKELERLAEKVPALARIGCLRKKVLYDKNGKFIRVCDDILTAAIDVACFFEVDLKCESTKVLPYKVHDSIWDIISLLQDNIVILKEIERLSNDNRQK